MTVATELPRAAWPFVEFSSVLRAAGFAVAPEQTQNFIASVGLLGPRGMTDIHRAALATLAPPPERRSEFDALFRAIFLGQAIAAPMQAEGEEEEVVAYDDRAGTMPPPEADEETESGGEATLAERLAQRGFGEQAMDQALRRLGRQAPEKLPQRASRRRIYSHHGDRPDMRRALRQAAHRDGEVLQLPMRGRRMRQRRVILLVDISGSMKQQTEMYMRFAHVLARSAQRCETFTLGTRLTRVTRALKIRNQEQALATASTLVADWDGGTRLGEALQAFLSVPRFAGFARGAMVVMLSDGLERGDHHVLVDAVTRLKRLAWAVLWLTPLAGDQAYVPQTEAMKAVEPLVDRIAGGATIDRLCEEVLGFERRAA